MEQRRRVAAGPIAWAWLRWTTAMASVTELVEGLDGSPAEVVEAAATALVDAIQSDPSTISEAVAAGAATKALVLLQGSDTRVATAAVDVLNALTAHGTTAVTETVDRDEGVIPRLVEVMLADPRAVRSAVAVLRRLSSGVDATTGAIPELSRRVVSADQTSAVKTLEAICSSEFVNAGAARAVAVAVVAALGDPRVVVVSSAVGAVSRCSPSSMEDWMAAGVMAALVRLIDPSQDAAVIEAAAQALVDLRGARFAGSEFRSAHGPPRALWLLSSTDGANAENAALLLAMAFRNAREDRELALSLANRSSLARLVDMLRGSSARESEAKAADLALRYLRHSPVVDELLIPIFRTRGDSVGSMRALDLLSNNFEASCMEVPDLIQSLVELLDPHEHDQVVERAALLLSRMTMYSERPAEAVVEAGGIAWLVHFITVGPQMASLRCSELLGKMPERCAEEIVRLVAPLLAATTHTHVREHAASVLRPMITPTAVELLLAHDVPVKLCALLEADDVNEAHVAAICIEKFAETGEVARQALVDCGGVELMTRSFVVPRGGSTEVIRTMCSLGPRVPWSHYCTMMASDTATPYAAKMAAHMIGLRASDDTIGEILSRGVHRELVRLLSNPVMQVDKTALATLMKLVELNAEVRPAVVEAGIMPKLLTILSEVTDSERHQVLTRAIATLTRDSLSAVRSFVEHGGVDVLVNTLTIAFVYEAPRVWEILQDLIRVGGRSVRRAIIEAGAIQRLETIGAYDDSHITRDPNSYEWALHAAASLQADA